MVQTFLAQSRKQIAAAPPDVLAKNASEAAAPSPIPTPSAVPLTEPAPAPAAAPSSNRNGNAEEAGKQGGGEYIQKMREAGYPLDLDKDLNTLITLRSLGVTPEYAKSMA